jgi:hypothetical protein
VSVRHSAYRLASEEVARYATEHFQAPKSHGAHEQASLVNHLLINLADVYLTRHCGMQARRNALGDSYGFLHRWAHYMAHGTVGGFKVDEKWLAEFAEEIASLERRLSR